MTPPRAGHTSVRRLRTAGLVACIVIALSALAARAEDEAGHDVTATPIFTQKLPNAPGKTMTVVSVDYEPGGASRPHHHGASAAIFAYVVAGTIRSQVEGAGEPRVYRVGDSWYEPPGAHHLISENASTTEPARLIAVFVADDGETLTTFDPAQ
jgi:quercetin dioxygenase-like cupin family protein